MLFAQLGYSSLWQFATQYLGLSEGAAQRRIAACRLSRQIPAVKEAISTGALSLANAAALNRFINHEKKDGRPQTTEQKKSLLDEVRGLSQAECEKKLYEASPKFETSQKDSLKPISAEQSLLKITLDSKVAEKLKLLKDRLSHKMPNASYAELIQYLIQDKLEQIEKKMTPKPTREKPTMQRKADAPIAAATAAAKIVEQSTCQPTSVQRKAIPMNIRRILWKRSGGRCEYEALDGKKCASTKFLEVDHIQSVALGGCNELLNCRLVCRIHNQLFAKETFSSKWMEKFIPTLRR